MFRISNLNTTFASLLLVVIALAGCSGGGSGASAPSTATWYASDVPTQSAGQAATFFDANQLYFNVLSAANVDGEIRGEITPSATVFQADGGDPFAANPGNNPVTFAAILGGDQVRPRNVITSANGYGSVTLDPLTKQLTGFLVASGISGNSARLHDGLPGSSGAIVLSLEGGPVIWTIPAGTTLSDQQIARLNAGAYYFDVQSTVFPDGEIRGQLNQQVRFAALKGASEVPPVTTSASGAGFFAVNPSTLKVSGFVKVNGLSSPVTLAAVQIGAAGINGLPAITLTDSGNGIFTVPPNTVLSSTLLANFNNDELYYNIHTQNNTGGELRGQILKSTIRIGTATLAGTKEVPQVLTKANGTGMIAINSITEQVSASVKTSGLTGTSVQLHSGSTAVNGPALISLSTASPVIATPIGGISFGLDIQPIFTANCLFSCHVTGGIAPLSLQPGLAYANIISRVDPGSSSTSYLIGRLTGSIPPRMPLISPPLDTATIDLVRGWIDKGALDN